MLWGMSSSFGTEISGIVWVTNTSYDWLIVAFRIHQPTHMSAGYVLSRGETIWKSTAKSRFRLPNRFVKEWRRSMNAIKIHIAQISCTCCHARFPLTSHGEKHCVTTSITARWESIGRATTEIFVKKHTVDACKALDDDRSSSQMSWLKSSMLSTAAFSVILISDRNPFDTIGLHSSKGNDKAST